jgi:hypothetical protein
VLNVKAIYLRVEVLDFHDLLLHEFARILISNKQSHFQDTLARLQERLIETLIRKIDIARIRYVNLSLEKIKISFNVVVTREGIVQNASIL